MEFDSKDSKDFLIFSNFDYIISSITTIKLNAQNTWKLKLSIPNILNSLTKYTRERKIKADPQDELINLGDCVGV